MMVAALAAGTMAMAQTYVGEMPIEELGYSVPADFTTVGHTLLCDFYLDDYNHHPDSAIFYDNTLTRVHALTNFPEGFRSLYFCDYDLSFRSYYGYIYFTQSLFNNDALFEYYVENEDGTGSIVSENGTVIWSWSPSVSDFHEGGMSIFKWDNQYFIETYERYGGTYNSDWGDYEGDNVSCKLYRIERQTQSITQVNDVPFNVFPTVAERGRDITVQLGEGTNASEIVVVDGMGREVKKVPVAPGQREVKVSTRGLGAGMNFISDRRNGAVKIIVQ